MKETEALLEELVSSMFYLDENKVYALARKLQDCGAQTPEILDCLNQGMKEVGKAFETGEYFIADLMFAGTIYCAVLNSLVPPKNPIAAKKKCRILVGVVKNDIHDIGKDIIVSLLRADNFDVIDLGVDVTPEAFIEGIRTYQPQILSLSGMMSYSTESMRRTIEAIKAAGLRDTVSILLGGGCTNARLLQSIDADAVCMEPADTLRYCNDFASRRFL